MKRETNFFDLLIAFEYVIAAMSITHQIVGIWR